MAKILKNTTNTGIDLDIGLNVPANGQITISPQDYDEASASDDIIEFVGSGDIIVNDGSFDLSKSEGIRFIQGGYTNRVQLDNDLLSSDRIKVDVTGTLSDAQIKVSNNDSTSGFLEDKILSSNNKINITTLNDGGDEDLQLELIPSNIGTSELNNDANFIDSAGAPVQPSDLSNFETSAQLDARDVANRNRSNHTGTQLSSTISDFGSAVQSNETVTNLTFNNTTKVLTFTNEAGTLQNVDLTQFLDDTNLARITGGTLNAGTGIATFTRDDLTTFTVDFSSLNDQSFINAAIDTHENTIDNHDDVNTSGATIGDVLEYDGTNWIPKSSSKYTAYAVRTTGEVNQLNSLREYLTLAAVTPVAGDYKISWSYEWSVNTTGNDFVAQLELDDSTILMNCRQEPKDSGGTGVILPNTEGGNSNTGTNQRFQCSGFRIVTLTAGSHDIDLDYRSEIFDIEAAIYQASIMIEEL